MITLLLWACGPKSTEAVSEQIRSTRPEPLAVESWQSPQQVSGALSNGIPVMVVENHEVPLVYVRLVAKRIDDNQNPVLASVAMDMLNEGAGDLDAEAINDALRGLASKLHTGAGADYADVGTSFLTRNTAPTLDLMAQVVLDPTYPEVEWDLIKKQRIQDLEGSFQDQNAMAGRVLNKVLYGDVYKGNLPMQEHYEEVTLGQMKSWVADTLAPDNVLFLVGGDTTLAEIQPLLEARFGSWERQGEPPNLSGAGFQLPDSSAIYLVDKPGATQSTVRLGAFTGQQTDPDYGAKKVADLAIGGFFSSRINMNLREDKGYTYGAGGWTNYDRMGGLYRMWANVRTDTTAASIQEFIHEISRPGADGALTEDEVAGAKGYWLGTMPLRFENPGFMLDQLRDVWLYDLPEAWIADMKAGVADASAQAATDAWVKHIDPTTMTYVVVGDRASIEEGLTGLGLPIHHVDAHGEPTQ